MSAGAKRESQSDVYDLIVAGAGLGGLSFLWHLLESSPEHPKALYRHTRAQTQQEVHPRRPVVTLAVAPRGTLVHQAETRIRLLRVFDAAACE